MKFITSCKYAADKTDICHDFLKNEIKTFHSHDIEIHNYKIHNFKTNNNYHESESIF